MTELNEKLLDAVQANCFQSVKQLLELGANPNYSEDDAQLTSLHIAVTFESVDVIPLLITAGADIHAETDEGIMPIQLLPALQRKNITLFLLRLYKFTR